MKKLITIISIGILFLTSCKKDEIPQPNQPSNPVVYSNPEFTVKTEKPIVYWDHQIQMDTNHSYIDWISIQYQESDYYQHQLNYGNMNYIVYGTDTLYDGQTVYNSTYNSYISYYQFYRLTNNTFYDKVIIPIQTNNLIGSVMLSCSGFDVNNPNGIIYPLYKIKFDNGIESSLQIDSTYLYNNGNVFIYNIQ